MMDLHESLLVKTVRRALVAAVAVGSMAVLLDAGATYPGLTWRAASLAREPSELERAPAPCSGAPQVAPQSPVGDESFDIVCGDGATVNAVGDLPRAELLSLPSDWLYHRALHF